MKNILQLFCIFYFFNFFFCYAEPTLLKKIEKKEKYREEILVTKKSDLKNLYLKHYLSLDLVKKIFPEATYYTPIDKETFSTAIYKEEELLGYLFETFDVTKGLGYSRRPFHIAVGIDLKGFIKKVELLKHVEPIAILGRNDTDLINYLEQYKNIDLKSGISLTLALTGADIEGDNFAMRQTAGEIKNLTEVDGVSRTTTSSLLFMDAIIRGARKVARQKDILLAQNDLGNFIDLESYKNQSWEDLINDKSMVSINIKISSLNEAFEKKNYDVPRALKFKKENESFSSVFFTSVFPSGIGINILGRRWYDQYISAGRNVDDQVYFIAIAGDNWRELEGRLENIIEEKRIYLQQKDNKIPITLKHFKELPFNHSKKSPVLSSQGLIYLNSKSNLNPQEPFKIIYLIKNDKNKEVAFSLSYQLPKSYNKSSFKQEDPKNGLFQIWKANIVSIYISFFTVLLAFIFFIFNKKLTKSSKYFYHIRVFFLLWVLIWLGWYIGAQLSIIHLVNLLCSLISREGFITSFFIEPIISIVGIGTIISLIIWGRGVFCGWLCPFGAFQELFSKIGRFFKIKAIILPDKYDKKLRYFKYILLTIIVLLGLIESDFVNLLYNIEPFKTAITLRFIAPYKAVMWASLLLLISLFLERSYCRYICPLGAGLAIIGNIKIINILKRRAECGNPCKACKNNCPTGAILDNGIINFKECLGCLDCQVLYYDRNRCPALAVKKMY